MSGQAAVERCRRGVTVQSIRLSSGLAVCLLGVALQAQTVFHPTTTLAQERGANTSATESFSGQKNGNLPARNVSKVPIRTLLYPGSTAKIFAHLVPWFGFGNHADV